MKKLTKKHIIVGAFAFVAVVFVAKLATYPTEVSPQGVLDQYMIECSHPNVRASLEERISDHYKLKDFTIRDSIVFYEHNGFCRMFDEETGSLIDSLEIRVTYKSFWDWMIQNKENVNWFVRYIKD